MDVTPTVTVTGMDEAAAIRQLKRGDIGGLELLVKRYQVLATRAAYLVVRDPALAQDLVQTAFLRAFDRAASFDDSRPFAPWFLKLVINESIKAANRQGREVQIDHDPADVVPTSDISPERALEQTETADEVWATLARLNPAQRAAIVQRYYLGWTEAEISAALDCPPSTIKARLHAARECLRSLLRPASHDLETTL